MYKYNLTGIYWIKNEARYIPEYVEYHLLVGFDHFIFWDNESDDDLEETIAPYIEQGIVEIRKYPPDFPGFRNGWVMNHSIVEQRGISKWIHFHALDERLVNPEGRNVFEVLEENWSGPLIGGAAIPWVLINSSGHIARPPGLIIENYTQTAYDPKQHIKTIIRPEFAIMMDGNPHNFVFVDFKFAMNENGNIIRGPFSMQEYPMDKLKLYHYLSLSKEEFEEKMNKGVLDAGRALENARRADADFQWDVCHNPENLREKDYSMLKYVEPVRNAILNRYSGREHLLERINH